MGKRLECGEPGALRKIQVGADPRP